MSKCASLGKENWKDTCLSINQRKKYIMRHKYGFKGTVKIKRDIIMERLKEFISRQVKVIEESYC